MNAMFGFWCVMLGASIGLLVGALASRSKDGRAPDSVVAILTLCCVVTAISVGVVVANG